MSHEYHVLKHPVSRRNNGNTLPYPSYTLMEIAGHRLCKLCAKETVHHSHAAYENELRQRLLQQKIKNSGSINTSWIVASRIMLVAVPFARTMPIKLCQAFAQQIISDHYPNLLLIGTPGTGKDSFECVESFATFCITVQNLHATIPVQKML